MGTYDSQRALAQRLIQAKGCEVTFIRVTPVADGTNEWDNADPNEVAVSGVQAVFLNFNAKDMETLHRLGETDINTTDRKILIAATRLGGTAPKIGDFVDDGSIKWRVMWLQNISPNGEDILYTVRGRP